MDFSLDSFRKNLQNLEDGFLGKIHEKIEPAQKLIACYRCALMEVETSAMLNLKMNNIRDGVEGRSM
jgi:hypothetical protein